MLCRTLLCWSTCHPVTTRVRQSQWQSKSVSNLAWPQPKCQTCTVYDITLEWHNASTSMFDLLQWHTSWPFIWPMLFISCQLNECPFPEEGRPRWSKRRFHKDSYNAVLFLGFYFTRVSNPNDHENRAFVLVTCFSRTCFNINNPSFNYVVMVRSVFLVGWLTQKIRASQLGWIARFSKNMVVQMQTLPSLMMILLIFIDVNAPTIYCISSSNLSVSNNSSA